MRNPSTQLIAVLGPGGVGKTTLSASIALGLAKKDYSTCVITVDPAKRLAQALDLQNLSDEEQIIPSTNNNCSALWLDHKQGFKNLAKKYISNTQALENLYSHRFFKFLSDQLGGVEEYLAIDKLIELKNKNKYDYLILDTPPAQHALKFFDSPQRLVRFFDNQFSNFLEMNLEGDSSSEKSWFSSLTQKSKKMFFNFFESFLGTGYLNELLELIQLVGPMKANMIQSSQELQSWINDQSTQFHIVSSPERYSLQDACALYEDLKKNNYKLPNKFIINKSLPDYPQDFVVASCSNDNIKRLLEDSVEQKKYIETITNKYSVHLEVKRVLRYSYKSLDIQKLSDIGTEII